MPRLSTGTFGGSCANGSPLKRHIGAIIPLVNNHATGYEPRKSHNRLDMFNHNNIEAPFTES